MFLRNDPIRLTLPGEIFESPLSIDILRTVSVDIGRGSNSRVEDDKASLLPSKDDLPRNVTDAVMLLLRPVFPFPKLVTTASKASRAVIVDMSDGDL